MMMSDQLNHSSNSLTIIPSGATSASCYDYQKFKGHAKTTCTTVSLLCYSAALFHWLRRILGPPGNVYTGRGSLASWLGPCSSILSFSGSRYRDNPLAWTVAPRTRWTAWPVPKAKHLLGKIFITNIYYSRCYIAEILPKWRKMLSNQSIDDGGNSWNIQIKFCIQK